MQFYFREQKPELIQLYYPVTSAQFQHIVNYLYKLFPTRFFTKSFFCPLLSKEYACRVAAERNNWQHEDTDSIHILRFLVRLDYLLSCIDGSINNDRARINIPQSDLHKLNQNIVGYIERVEVVNLIKDNV